MRNPSFAERNLMDPRWQPMDAAPRDGSSFVVKQVIKYQHNDVEEIMIVRWSEYSDGEGGWWLEEGAVIRYDTCVGWWPIPQSGAATAG